MRAFVALVAAAVHALPAAAGQVTLTWSATPGATAIRSGCTIPSQYENAPVAINGAAAGSVTVQNLPDAGRCYFALNAGPQDEWFYDFDALKGGPGIPGSVGNFEVTWSPTPPPPAVSVTLTPVPADSEAVDEYFLTVTGSSPVTIALAGGTTADWVKQGAAAGGSGGTVVTTTPALGANNNDGVTAATFSVTGPVNGARTDFDGPAFTGGSVTVAGVTKALVKGSGSWTVTFP